MRQLTAVLIALSAVPAIAGVRIVDEDGGAAPRIVVRPTAAPTGLAAMQPAGEPVKAEDPPPAKPSTWTIDPETDKTYKAAFTRWAKSADWELIWLLPKPYEVSHRSPRLTGDFIPVLSTAASALGSSIGAVDLKFWEGNRVVTIAPLVMPTTPPQQPATSDNKSAKKRKAK